MNLKEIKDLIDLITEKGITEFELERGGVRLRIKRGANSVPQVSWQGAEPLLVGEPVLRPVAPVLSGQAVGANPGHVLPEPVSVAEAGGELHVVKSPMVGTFYDAPAPEAPPFVSVGDRVEVGQVLCIIEAMKLMNEIESDVAGEIVKRYVENAQPVEYGESLFALRPSKGKR